MNYQNRFYLDIAKPEDSYGIKKIFDDDDFSGKIAVKFSRDPDPYKSFLNDGEHIILPIAKDAFTHEIVGVGGCVIRQGFINGELINTAYLTGMKILKSHRGKVNVIKHAYKLIGERAREFNPFFYTTILKSNIFAIKLLEKPHRDVPPYIYSGEYTVFCLGTKGKVSNKKYRLVQGHSLEISNFYKEHLPKYNLSPKDEWLYGLKSDDFFSLRSESGNILAACAIWDQQEYKQYTITHYGGIYKLFSLLPIDLLGYPKMPKVSIPSNYASIALLIIPEENKNIAETFLKLVLSKAKKYEFLMLGLFENHPLFDIAKSLKHIKYQSRFYNVDYGEQIKLDERPIMLEVGFL